jgi:hypothetical protein
MDVDGERSEDEQTGKDRDQESDESDLETEIVKRKKAIFRTVPPASPSPSSMAHPASPP